MQNKQNTPSNLVIPPITDILKQFVAFLKSIWVQNQASYQYLPEFRARVNALVLPWLIFSAACLVGIGISLFMSLAGR